MDPPDSSPTCRVTSNNNPQHCTLQQEFLKFQSDEFYEALEPAFNPTSNTLQRRKLSLGTAVKCRGLHITASASRRCWGSVFRSVAVLSPVPVSGHPALFSHVSGSRCLAPFQRVNTQSTACPALSRTSRQRHHPYKSHRNKAGLNTGTSEVSSNAVFFSLRCCQLYNPAGVRQPALSAGHGESDALGFALPALQHIVTMSTGEPKHRTLPEFRTAK